MTFHTSWTYCCNALSWETRTCHSTPKSIPSNCRSGIGKDNCLSVTREYDSIRLHVWHWKRQLSIGLSRIWVSRNQSSQDIKITFRQLCVAQAIVDACNQEDENRWPMPCTSWNQAACIKLPLTKGWQIQNLPLRPPRRPLAEAPDLPLPGPPLPGPRPGPLPLPLPLWAVACPLGLFCCCIWEPHYWRCQAMIQKWQVLMWLVWRSWHLSMDWCCAEK